MQTLTTNKPWWIQDLPEFSAKSWRELVTRRDFQFVFIAVSALILFLAAGPVLQFIDPAAGILDIGIVTVLLLGLLAGLAAILCSLWLQELLWQPFKTFRKQFHSHFNQLTSWQQCILYFSVFFLLLYAMMWGFKIVL